MQVSSRAKPKEAVLEVGERALRMHVQSDSDMTRGCP
jgi:hypothetical protein